MRIEKTFQSIEKQNGLALLVLVIVIILGVGSYTLTGLSVNQLRADQKKQTAIALNKAKKALIAYAVNYPEITPANRGPGYFLCPDTDDDGVAEAGCNGPATVGRLPWRTLETGDLRDGASERLWYAVSENFDSTPSPFRPNPPYAALTRKVLNTETVGNITFRDRRNTILNDGTTVNAAVAVIIAPGEILTRDDGVVQNRSAANLNVANNYLDIADSGEDNSGFQQTSLDGFIDGEIMDAAGNVIVNDQIAVITYGDIMEQVHKRVAREISNVINRYFTACNDYPEAAVFVANGLGPFNSVQLSQQGILPVDAALPVDWNVGCAIGISLPVWIQSEDWHLSSYYQYSYTKAVPAPPPPGVLAANCVTTPPAAVAPAVECLTVNNTDLPINDKSALIILSGRLLLGQDRNTPPVMMSDYFENENNNGDLIFDAAEIEDYIWVIAP